MRKIYLSREPRNIFKRDGIVYAYKITGVDTKSGDPQMRGEARPLFSIPINELHEYHIGDVMYNRYFRQHEKELIKANSNPTPQEGVEGI